VYDFALQQMNLPLQTPEQVAEVGENILRQLAGEYPHLAEMITEHAPSSTWRRFLTVSPASFCATPPREQAGNGRRWKLR
jgi:hypothetical protein